MIDGLEISEVYFSKIKHDQNERLDSHYYEKKYILLKRKLLAKPYWLLGDIVLKPIQTGHTPLMSNPLFYGGEIAFIKTDNLRVNYITTNFNNYLSSEGNQEISRTELQEKDIITTIIGATEDVIARTALVLPEHLPANINQNIVQIRVDETFAFSEYVNAYLNSRYGRDYLRYLSRQTEQVNLNCQEVSSVIVPKLSTEFQDVIRNCVSKAYQLQRGSNETYLESEKILEESLCIKQSSNDSVSIKTLSESFNISGRLDAEYYQPKYDELFAMLSKHKSKNLGGKNGLVNIKKSIEPGSESYKDEGIPFVRVSDIDKFEITSPEIKLPQDIVPNIENLYPKKDTILLSKDGSVGIAHKVQEALEVVTSGALLHLTVKDTKEILPDYLTLVLNSSIVQLQAERDCNGAIIQHWKPADIEKVIIPILDMEKQIEIADKVQESFRLRKKSKKLLDIAVRAVEMAIETDEETAIAWMKEQGV